MKMKNSFNLLIIISIIATASCEKIDTEIATVDELSAISYSENIMCQPIKYKNYIVALTNKNGSSYLSSYDIQGNIQWKKPVDEYSIPGVGFDLIRNLTLEKTPTEETVLEMYFSYREATNAAESLVIKTVGFDSTGQYLWQMIDTIHQPKNINIGPVVTPVNPFFRYVDMVHLSDGNHLVISAMPDRNNDSTYIQVSAYDISGLFAKNVYMKIPGVRTVKEAFLTSENNLLLFSEIENISQLYTLMDFGSNIIFEIKSPAFIFDHFLIYESSKGNFIISASTIDNTGSYIGNVFSFDKTGIPLWTKTYSNSPTMIMMSVQEKEDAYIFSGFTSGTTILIAFDWRDTFTQNEYHSVIQKIDLSGKVLWINTISGITNTAGAISIGDENISFYLGKYDNSIKSIYLVKLDSSGNIIN